MDTPRKNVQSEITKIFDEYRAKLDEIAKKSNERYSQLVDEESNPSIENNYKKLAEIIVEKQQESQDILEDVE